MPTYNRGYIIKNAIQSILEQTISNWELIIIDDASTDNTEDIVKSFNDPRIIYIKNKRNLGANFARNRGCSIAKGDFLAFLDSDNIWTRNKLERQLKVLMHSSEDIAFVFTRVEIIDDKKVVVPDKDFKINRLEKLLRYQNVIDTNTVLLKKSVFMAVDGFDNDMPRIQDWDLFFKIIIVYHYRAIYIPEILVYNKIQPNSISKFDCKLQKASSIFLKKYKEYLSPVEISRMIKGLLSRTQDKDETLLFIKEFIGNEKTRVESLYVALAEEFYNCVQDYNMLLLWKKNMEMSVGRTIFSEDYKRKDFIIALYGLGVWGELIYSEAKNCGVRIKYGMDKKVKEFHDLEIVDIQEIPKTVNLVIVSIFQGYDRIREQLTQYYKGEILSIDDLLKGV